MIISLVRFPYTHQLKDLLHSLRKFKKRFKIQKYTIFSKKYKITNYQVLPLYMHLKLQEKNILQVGLNKK